MSKFSPAWIEQHRVDITTLERSAIIGIGHVTAELDGLAARLRDPDRAAAMGLVPPRGILLWGAPGLGKTLSARVLAHALGLDVPFYEVSADELTPDRIRGLFRWLADQHPRSCLYIDEIDTIGMGRDYSSHDRDTRLRLTALLAALDGLVPTRGPVIIASSNRPPEHLDTALVRAGRLGFRVRFTKPDEGERTQLLRLFARKLPVEPDIDWLHVARLTRERTPADLRQIVEDAASLALGSDRDRVATADLVMAVRRGGRIEPEPQQPDHVRDRIAAHEAGHVAACVALRGPEWVYAVTIGPMSGDTAFGDEHVSWSLRADDENRDALVVSFAGAYAERALLGEASSSSGSDIASATRLALERTRTGLSEGLTPLDLDKLDTNVSEILKVELANDLIAQISTARALAAVIVEANVESIRRFAAALAAARELTGPELRAAVDAAGFVPVERP